MRAPDAFVRLVGTLPALALLSAQPAVAALPGDPSVGWDDGSALRSGDTYAQPVLASGVVSAAWGLDGRAVSTAASNPFSSRLIADGAGGAIISWYDERPLSSRDIYVQWVQSNSALGGVVVDVPEGLPSALVLEPPLPSSARTGRLSVSQTLAGGSDATIELLDLPPRRLAVREVGGLGPGSLTLDLREGRRVAPGMSFVWMRQGAGSRIVRAEVLD